MAGARTSASVVRSCCPNIGQPPPLRRRSGRIEKYPDNFLVGSDVVANFDGYSKKIRKYDELFGALSRATADKVARANFLTIMPSASTTVANEEAKASYADTTFGHGLTVDPGYGYPDDKYTTRAPPSAAP